MSRENDELSEQKEGAGASRRRPRAAAGRPERPQASHLSLHHERTLRDRRKKRRLIIMAVAECIALVLIFGYAYFLRKFNQIQRPEFDEVAIKNNDLNMDTVERMKGYWTIACFGVDARDNETILKNTNADVNIIANINMDTGDIKLVSVYRDSYLNISEKGSYNKINQAYFVGGPQQAVAALNRNLDLDITDYVTFNWKAVADAINILGGVDVEISKAEFYYINSFITETVKATGVGSHQLKSAGMNHLDGVQAVAYGRLRLMDTDYARTERQRKIIKLAFEKAKKADFDTLNRVLGTVFPQVATSITANDLFNCLKIISRFNLSDTTGFPQARGSMMMGKKGDCVIPQTLESNVVKLHEFLFSEENYQPSSTVTKISQKIASDSGMYKEGKYVDSVGTDGGVIQSEKAKKTAEAASSAADKSDEKYAVVYVLDENGKKVKKSVVMETDADGDYLEPETNADGLASGWSINSDGKLVSKGTDAAGETTTKAGSEKTTETGADGKPVQTSESGTLKSMETETDADGRPVQTSESTSSGLRPGFLDESQSSTGSSTSAGPGSQTSAAESTSHSTAPTAANSTSTAPGSTKTTETSSGSTGTAPGSTTSTTAANQTQIAPGGTTGSAPTAAVSDGTTNSPAPTSAAAQTTASGGPGSSTQTVINSEAPTSGTVAAPGQ